MYFLLSLYKIVNKFVAKLIKYTILTILGFDYRDASLIALYLVVIGIRILVAIIELPRFLNHT